MASLRTRKRKAQRRKRKAYYADLAWWGSLTQAQRLEADYERATRKQPTLSMLNEITRRYMLESEYLGSIFETSSLYDRLRRP